MISMQLLSVWLSSCKERFGAFLRMPLWLLAEAKALYDSNGEIILSGDGAGPLGGDKDVA
jgi:hypothetical protein